MAKTTPKVGEPIPSDLIGPTSPAMLWTPLSFFVTSVVQARAAILEGLPELTPIVIL